LKGRILYKIAFLYSRLSGYFQACLRTLKSTYDVRTLVYHFPTSENAPFKNDNYSSIDLKHLNDNASYKEILNNLKIFSPDVILVSGWMDKEYLKVARHFKKRNVLTIAMSDAQWQNNLKQNFIRFVLKGYLHSCFDYFWVAGERQKAFAHKLGFNGNSCLTGIYSCDWESFAFDPLKNDSKKKNTFLYTGRYVDIKGLDTLIEAYQEYRMISKNPWKLIFAGKGPNAYLLNGKIGIENRGFVQPDKLPSIMRKSGAFVLPSKQEPWGVVIHEATSAGLPILCSDSAGAAVHLVRDGYNGHVFQPGNVNQLSRQMLKIERLETTDLQLMGHRSYELSKQFTPSLWADTLMEILKSNSNYET